MFDWVNSTVEELAAHIANISAQSTQTQLRYYKQTNNKEMICKIKDARVVAKKIRVIMKAEQYKNEMNIGE